MLYFYRIVTFIFSHNDTTPIIKDVLEGKQDYFIGMNSSAISEDTGNEKGFHVFFFNITFEH